MRQDRKSTAAVNGTLQRIALGGGKLTGLGSPYCFKVCAYLKNLAFGHEQASFHERARGLRAAAVMFYRLAAYMKLKPEAGNASVHPVPNGFLVHTFYEAGGLQGVVAPLSRLLVDIRLSIHPRKVARRRQNLTRKISRVLRALPGLLVARKAGASLTGAAPAVQSTKERSDASGADWRSDSTGFYE
jgi:hypothetical protein